MDSHWGPRDLIFFHVRGMDYQEKVWTWEPLNSPAWRMAMEWMGHGQWPRGTWVYCTKNWSSCAALENVYKPDVNPPFVNKPLSEPHSNAHAKVGKTLTCFEPKSYPSQILDAHYTYLYIYIYMVHTWNLSIYIYIYIYIYTKYIHSMYLYIYIQYTPSTTPDFQRHILVQPEAWQILSRALRLGLGIFRPGMGGSMMGEWRDELLDEIHGFPKNHLLSWRVVHFLCSFSTWRMFTIIWGIVVGKLRNNYIIG